jgi:hypothetical protein
MNKLKYHISQSTTFETSEVIANIVGLLNEHNYRVLEVTRTTVSFDDGNSGLMWGLQSLDRMGGGKFMIIDDGPRTVVTFDYYPFADREWPLAPGLATILSVIAILRGNYFVSIIATGYLVQLIAKNRILQGEAYKMLTAVCREEPTRASLHLQTEKLQQPL